MLLFLAVFSGVLVLDFTVKHIIEKHPASYWRKKKALRVFPLDRVHNHGMILGLAKQIPALAKSLPVVMLAIGSILLFLLEHGAKKSRTSLAIAAGLILGGGACNALERIKKGYVVDYIHLPIRPIRHITFNLSDFSIFAGLLWFLSRL